MDLKNKELEKLYDSITLYFDSWCLPSLITAFMVCDDAIEGEIAAIKAELTEANQRLNNEHKHGEDLADANCQLASENVDLKAKTSRLTFLENSKAFWRKRAHHAEKEVEDLNKMASELEEENETLRSKLEKVDKEYSHEFEFGDKVFVPWSDEPYMYIKPGELYNPRTKSCAYVVKAQHLKWFGERFEIK